LIGFIGEREIVADAGRARRSQPELALRQG
jgi:hypothetical protein